MNIDKFGRVEITEAEAVESIYCGKLKSLDSVYISGNIDQFNRALQKNADSIAKLSKLEKIIDLDLETFDKKNQSEWFMPDNYCPNLIKEIYELCQTEEQRTRVDLELELFVKNNLLDVLYYLKYLIDQLRQNKIVWGVGRGSCVASYVLYLIGVHKIDSLKYQIDIDEFLK